MKSAYTHEELIEIRKEQRARIKQLEGALEVIYTFTDNNNTLDMKQVSECHSIIRAVLGKEEITTKPVRLPESVKSKIMKQFTKRE